MRVRPRSSEKKAWLLSPPSIVLLLSKPEIPRKLINPNVPSGTALGERTAKLDQRRPLIGNSLIDVWLKLLLLPLSLVLTTGASDVTCTSAVAVPSASGMSTFVDRPISTIMLSALAGPKPLAFTSTE